MVQELVAGRSYTRQQTSCTVQITVCLLATTYLTNFMERGPFRNATRFSDDHETPRILCNSKVHCRVLNSPPLVPTLSQINPSQPLLSYTRKMFVNITFPFILGNK